MVISVLTGLKNLMSCIPEIRKELVRQRLSGFIQHLYLQNAVNAEICQPVRVFRIACEFYDLSTDPDEENNLYGNPVWEEQIQRLKSEMEEWFDRYTDPKMDARKGGAVGRGQEKMCYEENAFDQSIELYYKDKEKCRV